MTLRSRIAIVEHHGLIRRGLEHLLDEHPPVHVVAVAAEPARLPTLPFDVIVLGSSAADEERLANAVARLAPRGRVLVVGEFTRPVLVAAAIRSGAYGCVIRRADDATLLRAVDAVAHGALHVAAELADRVRGELHEPAAGRPPVLAPREAETLRWLAVGLTHGQIARRMSLTEATVSTYIKRIRSKLGVGNKAELTRLAIELGLLSDETRADTGGHTAAGAPVPGQATVRRLPRAFSA